VSLRSSLIVLVSAGIAVAAGLFLLTPEPEQQAWSVLATVCSDCHNDVDLAGDLSFAGLSAESIPEHPEIFEAVASKLRGHLMPPPGGPRPEQPEIDALIGLVESKLDAHPAGIPGHVRAQRLTRTEYAGAVRGLLGVDIDPAEYLPTEIEVEGFTNIASALSVSPTFIEQYVNVARAVAHLAVGEPAPRLAAAYYPAPSANQRSYIDGFPLGTRGGIRISQNFPADGEYRVTINDLGVGLYPSAVETEHTLVILVDNEERFRATLGGPEDLSLVNRGGAPGRAELMQRFTDIPLEVRAGTHDIVITFVERSRASGDDMIGSGMASRSPGISGGIDVVGPFNASGVSRTPSRELVFVCEPEIEARERECAERIAARLAERAFRRPVTSADLDRLMPFFDEGRTGPGGFDEGIELIVTAVLASPDFLYRTITPPEGFVGDSFTLDDYELATRLAFFIWSQGPDDELLELAHEGRLTDPAVLASQTERMLADPRAEVLVTGFALPWLGVDDLEAVQPDPDIFPGEFSDALREDFANEMRLFASSILLADANVQALLTAEHTYVNDRLARHYGIDGVFGPQFRRIELADDTRHGLLGKGAVLLRTSYGDRTSPVLRGAWVLEKLMGTPPTPPPPGVETDLTTPEGEQPKTIRARLEQHRANPNCGACHGAIDPYGLALENFSVTGRWRDVDLAADAPIDASAVLPGGVPVAGPAGLRESLLSRPDQFVQAMTQKLMMYALGREIEYFDMPTVRSIVREAETSGYRFSAIVTGIVQSQAFRTQSLAADEAAASVSVALGAAPDRQDQPE